MDKLTHFKSKAREIHGDRYDYSQVTVLRSMDDEVMIVCPKHGPFKQKAKGHIYTKNGCRKCKSSERLESSLEVRANRFISRAKATHGDRYDYSQVAYESIHKPVTIICREHGPFNQTPNNHVNGAGCPKCAKERGPWNKEVLEGFIARATQRHGGRYDYSQVSYVDAHTKITIICPEHGPFNQTPNRHLYGDGCPECGKQLAVENRRNNVAKERGHIQLKREKKPRKIKPVRSTTTKKDEFIQKAKKIHGDRYNYSKVEFINRLNKVTIICPEHGLFKQKPAYHIAGNGCPKCKFAKLSKERSYTQEEFMRNMEKIFGDSLDFSEAVYLNERSAVKVVCPEHGSFHKEPKLLMLGGGCPKCNESNPERIIRGILDKLNLEYTQFDRKTLSGKKELDFVIPSANLAIECHGLYWHSSAVSKSDDWVKNHLRDKWQECNSKGIRLLQFYSDEIEEKRGIIETMISLRAKVYNGPKEYARRLSCKRVEDKTIVKAFLNENHIQGGNTRFDIAYGLFDDHKKLLSVMCFGKNISVRGGQDLREIELIRFASSGLVVGAASKLLIAFLSDHFDFIDSVISYSDNRFSDGGVYETLGFELEHEVPPSYFYFGRGIGRVHKASMTKKRLSEKFGNLLPGETEEENASKNGLHRIYDAGKKKYRLTLR